MTGRDKRRFKLDFLSGRVWLWGLSILTVAILFAGGFVAWASISDLELVKVLHEPQAAHVDQEELLMLVVDRVFRKAFEEAFEVGDESHPNQGYGAQRGKL